MYSSEKETGRKNAEEKVDEIGVRLKMTPRKSLIRLAQKRGVSESSAGTATKLPHLHLC
jgi:hypothetical protein